MSFFYSRTEQVLKHDVVRAEMTGKTIIKDNEEIEVDSVENRIVIFDGTLLHRSTTLH